MKLILMRSRVSLAFLGCLVMLSAAGFGQTADPNSLPSAPSASAQQNAPAKQPAPSETKPAPAPDSTAASGQNSQTAAPGTTPAAPPAQPAPASPVPAAPVPAAPRLEDPEKSDTDEAVTTIKVPVNEVRVIFTVTDKHGRYIKDLKKNDFNVIDDRKPAAQIRSFRSETDLPLQVGLLVDASNSVRDRFKFEQEAAIEFLNAIVRPRYDKAFVVGFDATPEVTQDFTDNTEDLSKGVRMLRAGGGTAMFDALYFACRDKLIKQEQVSRNRLGRCGGRSSC